MRRLLILLVLLASGCVRAPVGLPAHQQEGPWEHRFVEVPDRVDGAALRMHYLAAGPVDAPRVVLVHGFPDTAYGWRDVLPALVEDHRVLAPDLRGYGGTDRPEAGYEAWSLEQDIAGFIRAANAADGVPADSKVHLLTHDWGAAVGWWVAARSPELLRSFTALSVPHPLAWARFLEEDAEQRKRATYQKQLAGGGVHRLLGGLSKKQLASLLWRANLVHPEAFSDDDLQIYADTFRTADDWEPPLRYYRALQRTSEATLEQAKADPKVAAPTLVLWGESDDYLYPRQAPMSCEYVDADCEVEVFEEAGHWIQWDQPEALVARWRAFTRSR